jgi:hypothetical protein
MRERQAIEVGALTINEWRRSKGLEPVPWGDKWWGPVNKGAIEGADDTVPGGVDQAGGTQDGTQAADDVVEVLARSGNNALLRALRLETTEAA